MRNSTGKFLASLEKYLRHAFSDRVEKINRDNPEINLADINSWQSGYGGVAAGLSVYPGCLLLINGKTFSDIYTTTFNVVIGIGLTADDPEYLETIGHIWEDILEDSVRSDWHLGESCIDSNNAQLKSDCTSNVYVIQMEIQCDVDLGGYVYDDVVAFDDSVSQEEPNVEEDEGEVV